MCRFRNHESACKVGNHRRGVQKCWVVGMHVSVPPRQPSKPCREQPSQPRQVPQDLSQQLFVEQIAPQFLQQLCFCTKLCFCVTFCDQALHYPLILQFRLQQPARAFAALTPYQISALGGLTRCVHFCSPQDVPGFGTRGKAWRTTAP